jgi:hypothetical protein
MRKQIEIKSPVRAKDLEGRFHVLFNTLVGADGSRKEIFDTDKMVTLNLKKGEAIALIDEKGRFWELYRNEKGRHTMERLDENEDRREH